MLILFGALLFDFYSFFGHTRARVPGRWPLAFDAARAAGRELLLRQGLQMGTELRVRQQSGELRAQAQEHQGEGRVRDPVQIAIEKDQLSHGRLLLPQVVGGGGGGGGWWLVVEESDRSCARLCWRAADVLHL